MSRPTYQIWIIFLLALLVACAPSEAAIQAAIQATADAAPTNTPSPTSTATPRPTNTPRPTSTPVPTDTPDPVALFVGIWVNPSVIMDLRSDGKAELIVPGGESESYKWKLSGDEFCLYGDFHQDRCRAYELQGDTLQLIGGLEYERQDALPPTSVATDIETKYRNDAIRVSELYVAALEGLAAQSKALSADSNLLFDSRWKMETASYLVMMTTAGEYVRAMVPSARFQDAHTDLVEASVYYDLAAKLYSEGLDEIDADKIRLSSESLNNGTDALNTATEKFNALK